MERIEITFAQLEAKIRELVAANPDYVYPTTNSLIMCAYNATEILPPCIFGRAFSELGLPVPLSCEGMSITQVMPLLLVDAVSPRMLEWARTLQNNQDRGRPWQECLETADDYVARSYPELTM